MLKKLSIFSLVMLFAISAQSVLADDDDHDRKGKKRQPCPVATPYMDADGNAVPFEAKFGPGTLELMNCLQKREDVKLVMQINSFVDGRGRPYGFRNLPNMLNDYTITHGMDADEVDITVVIHGGGYPFVLDPDAEGAHPEAGKNTFKAMVTGLINRGVKVYFCMNTAAAKNIKTHQILPGVEYVTAGLTSISDFQARGYSYIQP